LAQGGIALATVISSVVNNLILFYFLKQDNLLPDMKALLVSALRGIVLSAVVMSGLSKVYALCEVKLMETRWSDAAGTFGLFLAAVFAYIVLAKIFRSPELAELFAVLKRKRRKN
jgi:putative peptidoglycan lipid II flippase